jgi:aminopeptidase C
MLKGVISSIYFTGNIVSKYYITKKQFNNNKTMIADIKDLKNNYIKLLRDDIKILHNKITELEIRLTTSLEDHNVLNIEKIDMISASTSLSSFTLDSSPKEVDTKNSDDDWHVSEKNDTFFEYI